MECCKQNIWAVNQYYRLNNSAAQLDQIKVAELVSFLRNRHPGLNAEQVMTYYRERFNLLRNLLPPNIRGTFWCHLNYLIRQL